MRRRLVLAILLATLSGCAIYRPQNVQEWVTMTKALDGSGCIYFRGNSRPYADVSVLAVSTWGKGAPKYIECLQSVPEAARALGVVTP